MLLRRIPYLLALCRRNQHGFILGKLFKKHKPTPQPQQPETKQKVVDEGHEEPEYDFFTRQRQMELNRDFRTPTSTFLPEHLGKGGFDEVVYWCQQARTLPQINEVLCVFNRMEVPDSIEDEYTFQQFVSTVIKHVYVLKDFEMLREYCTFGWRYKLEDEHFWRQLEDRVMRMYPQTQTELQYSLDIAFMMSKCDKGDVLYASMKNLYKGKELTPQSIVKILVIYCASQEGDKTWIQDLLDKLTPAVKMLQKDLLLELLGVMKQLKQIPSKLQQEVEDKVENIMEEFSFRELCYVSWFMGTEKGSEEFWHRLEHYVCKKLEGQPLNKHTLYYSITELLTSYKLSPQIITTYLMPYLQQDKYQVVHTFPPATLSLLSKTLYIYELEKQDEQLEELIQTTIMRQYSDLKNVKIEELVCVIKDYSVTRRGSRQLYKLLQEVVKAKLEEIKLYREILQKLIIVYEQSGLCSPQLLEKLNYYI